MAKYVATIKGDYRRFHSYLENEILSGSMSASLEEKHEASLNGVRCCVQVYERYSYMGGNRLSLNVTTMEYDGTIHLVAVASGGSQAIFFKINTFGEEAFLDKLKEAVEGFRS
jgi:hypothetical protein